MATHAKGSESHVTTNHNEIKKWAEARGGKPATVKSTGSKEEAGICGSSFRPGKPRGTSF